MRESFTVSEGLAEELFVLDKGADFEGYRLVETSTISRQSRWMTFRTIIFMRLSDQTYWSLTRGFGSTESQDHEEGPFEAHPVKPTAKVVVVYEPDTAPASE